MEEKKKEAIIIISDLHPPNWDECSTIEDWMRRALKEGREAEVITLMKLMPLDRRIYYRKIWKEMKEGEE